MITDKDVERFKQLYLDRFGEHLEDDRARDELTLLVSQMHTVYSPILKSDFVAIKDVDVEKYDKPKPYSG